MINDRIIHEMFQFDALSVQKRQLNLLASDIEPLAEENKVYMVMYKDGTFEDLDSCDYQEVIAGRFDAIYFKEDNITKKQYFQIVLIDMVEPRKLVISGGANTFVILDFINRLCNIENPDHAKIELYSVRNGQYVNGWVREAESGSELQPLMYYKDIPKDKAERLKLYLEKVSDLMKRKEAFAESKK
jgi:hypothetical protein